MSIYAGTVGARINVTFTSVFDISPPGVLKLRVKTPSGKIKTWVPIVDNGPAGLAHYITAAGDIDEDGQYFVNTLWWPGDGSGPFPGERGGFTVKGI